MVRETESGAKVLECDCAETEQRFRVRKNDAAAYVVQCLTCGREIRQVRANTPGLQRIPFDETLQETWQRKLKTFWKLQTEQREAQREKENTEWWQRYNLYLKSKDWQERRRLVLERDKYVCQGCMRNKATQVHHLTYEHVTKEFLFELTSLCEACHRRIHPRNTL